MWQLVCRELESGWGVRERKRACEGEETIVGSNAVLLND
jgi:hypothetical protein